MENLSLQKNSQDMMSIIREWEQSGQSQKVFCQIKNIPHSKFYYWLRKLRDSQSSDSQTDFIAVRIRQNKNVGDLDIQYPNGVIIKLHSPFDLVMVKTLLQIF
jgi:hypothetical protein